jgi:ribosomal protein L30
MVTIVLKRSLIGRTKEVQATLFALGLKKIGDSRKVSLENVTVRGMVRRVAHLLEVL